MLNDDVVSDGREGLARQKACPVRRKKLPSTSGRLREYIKVALSR
jgi:hypothetical protein